jgi:hypothetical protein
VQRLRFHGRPLVQNVYLPKEGAPIARCVMAQSRPPTDHVIGQGIAGMNVVTWNKGALGYALIGSQQGGDLTAPGQADCRRPRGQAVRRGTGGGRRLRHHRRTGLPAHGTMLGSRTAALAIAWHADGTLQARLKFSDANSQFR